MRHEQHGAGIVVDHLFQEIERFEIEIVGRLVEHQQVRRLCQRAREREAAALAAGERADRRAGLLRREQKIPHVADDVARLPADEHLVAAPAGQRVAHRCVRIERFAALVERRHLQVDAERDRAAVGRELAGQHLQQRGLAGAVRADEARCGRRAECGSRSRARSACRRNSLKWSSLRTQAFRTARPRSPKS